MVKKYDSEIAESECKHCGYLKSTDEKVKKEFEKVYNAEDKYNTYWICPNCKCRNMAGYRNLSNLEAKVIDYKEEPEGE